MDLTAALAAPMAPRSTAILLTPHERATLEAWSRARTAPHRLVMRSHIVLMLADGHSGRDVAAQLGVSRHTVDLWRTRFLLGRCDGIRGDRPGRGRKRRVAKS